MIDYSKKRQGRAKDEKLSPQEMAVAELMAWGWDAVDAMLVVGILKKEEDPTTASHAALTFSSREDIDKLYKKRTLQLRNGSVLDQYQKLHPTPGTPGANRGAKKTEGSASTTRTTPPSTSISLAPSATRAPSVGTMLSRSRRRRPRLRSRRSQTQKRMSTSRALASPPLPARPSTPPRPGTRRTARNSEGPESAKRRPPQATHRKKKFN